MGVVKEKQGEINRSGQRKWEWLVQFLKMQLQQILFLR